MTTTARGYHGRSKKAELPGYRPATPWVHCTTSCNTRSSAPEGGRDQRPKQVELIGIINELLLLHLVGVYIIYEFYNLYTCCGFIITIETEEDEMGGTYSTNRRCILVGEPNGRSHIRCKIVLAHIERVFVSVWGGMD